MKEVNIFYRHCTNDMYNDQHILILQTCKMATFYRLAWTILFIVPVGFITQISNCFNVNDSNERHHSLKTGHIQFENGKVKIYFQPQITPREVLE